MDRPLPTKELYFSVYLLITFEVFAIHVGICTNVSVQGHVSFVVFKKSIHIHFSGDTNMYLYTEILTLYVGCFFKFNTILRLFMFGAEKIMNLHRNN
jgi:hypothetical protein